MSKFPKRRWLRFSVRTLLVAVTIFCVWLGWQMHIVHERKAVMQLLLDHNGGYPTVYTPGPGYTDSIAVPSLIRGWLGDTTHYSVWAYDVSYEEFERVVRAFPEAEVDVYDSKQQFDAPPIRYQSSAVSPDGRSNRPRLQ